MFDRKKFKALLILRDKTIHDVATVLGIDDSTVHRKMNGTSDFTRREIQILCKFLSIDNPMEIFFADTVA